jgi:hypothetical protein
MTKSETNRTVLFRVEVTEITYDDGSIVTGIEASGEKDEIPTDALTAIYHMVRGIVDGQKERGVYVPLKTLEVA